jgi:hypothetical protein
MPTVALPTIWKIQEFDVNGDPLSGGKLYTYLTGTATPKATYTDSTGNTANANPVILNARGEADVWILTDQLYRFKLHDASDNLIKTVDGIGYASPTFEDLTVTDDLTVGGDINGNVVGWLFIGTADESTSITTGTAKITFRLPACTVLAVRASLKTASSSGLPTFDINDDGTSILGANKLSIDANERTSTTAATQTTIANPTVADDSEMTVDIDVAGTGAVGWKIGMKVRLTA